MSRKQRIRDIEEPMINLTPLIDVVFVILIVFIIIAPLLEIDRVSLSDASGDPSKKMAASSQSALTIHVLENNAIRLNQQDVTQEQLLGLLKQAKQSAPSEIPQLFHDEKASFGTYQGVKNTVELAGYDRLDVVLKPGK